MKVNVQFFSYLQQVTGLDELPLDLPDGSSVAQMLQALYVRFPQMREADKMLQIAVGVEFARRDARLRDGDIVSLMPPLQGG